MVHGTNAKPSHGAIRQTSQQPGWGSAAFAAAKAAGAAEGIGEVVDACSCVIVVIRAVAVLTGLQYFRVRSNGVA